MLVGAFLCGNGRRGNKMYISNHPYDSVSTFFLTEGHKDFERQILQVSFTKYIYISLISVRQIIAKYTIDSYYQGLKM